MIGTLGELSARLAHRWMPDPFVFAILLTALTATLAVAYGPNVAPDALRTGEQVALNQDETGRDAAIAQQTGSGEEPRVGVLPRVRQVARYWIDPDKGFWFLLKFGMQMTVILVTGFALATTPIVRRMIDRLADVPRGPGSAAALVAFVAMAASFVHWGLGLMGGALLARAVGLRARARGVPIHYPLLGAAGYMGLMVWHGGWSGSAPLIFASDQLGMLGEGGALPFSMTILSPMNIAVALILLAAVPALFYFLAPREAARLAPCPLAEEAAARVELPTDATPAARLNRSRLLAWAIGLAGLYAVIGYAVGAPRADQIAVINGVFLFTGLILHGSPGAYVRAITEGARGAAGIILQFPFYAGIMGMMSASGLAALVSAWFARVSSPEMFPAMAFVSAALVNFFVPSGGGQVAVQGQVLIDSASSLGVPAWKAVMALSYGDEIGNMLQPFWALPLLAITGLEARQIMGYTILVMLLSAPIFIAALTFF